MKAITVHNPYPYLILTPVEQLPYGACKKAVENRTWPTSYRGPLLIHAGKSMKWLSTSEWPGVREKGQATKLTRDDFPDFQWGAVVGIVQLVACIDFRIELPYRYKWLEYHYHASGPYCWVLSKPQKFDDPVAIDGKQGLWDVDVDSFASLKTQVSKYLMRCTMPSNDDQNRLHSR